MKSSELEYIKSVVDLKENEITLKQNEIDRLNNKEEFESGKVNELSEQIGKLKAVNYEKENELHKLKDKLKECQESKHKFQIDNLNLTQKNEEILINVELLEKALNIRDNELSQKIILWDEKIKSIEKENSQVQEYSRQLKKFFVDLSAAQND